MTSSPAGGRTLWLLRHAKTVTDPPPGGRDFDRVLTPRGRRDATALGRRFDAFDADGEGEGDGEGDGDEGLPPALAGAALPTLALVSPSARTSATAELVVAEMARPPELRTVDDLYGADPDDVLALLRTLADDVPAVLVVGHNPTAQILSLGLLAHEDADGRSETVLRGFPTCALGVYRFDVTRWADVRAGTATLLALLTPPY